MAEKKMQIDNIKVIAEILKDGGLDLLKSGFADAEKRVRDFKALIEGKLGDLAAKKAAEAAKAAEEEAEKARLAQAAITPAPAETNAEVQPTETAEERAEKVEETAPETAAPAATEKKDEKKMPSFIVRREFVPDNGAKAGKPANRVFTPTDKPFGKKPEFNKTGARRPQAAYVAPPIIPTEDKRGGFNKKNSAKGEKNYEEKHVLNKRALIKNSISVEDFDENKTGYRKFRPVKKAKEQAVSTVKIEKAVVNSEIIPLKVLSEKIGITAAEITKRLFKEGIMKT
nr:hypothetical protein [Clostridia bacterium]